MLTLKNLKVNKWIIDKLKIETRHFPVFLRSSVIYVSEVSLFINTNFGKDYQRPYSENNFGMLYYEVVSSAFLLFKSYLDIIGRVMFNFCDKNLLPVLLKNRKELYRGPHKDYLRIKKLNKLKDIFFCLLVS